MAGRATATLVPSALRTKGAYKEEPDQPMTPPESPQREMDVETPHAEVKMPNSFSLSESHHGREEMGVFPADDFQLFLQSTGQVNPRDEQLEMELQSAMDEMDESCAYVGSDFTTGYSNADLVEEITASLKLVLVRSPAVDFWWCVEPGGQRESDARCPHSADEPLGRGFPQDDTPLNGDL